ncbi:2-keto-4-pentenoate hydratase [Aeromonas cavernicola]|nr:fumarylacetoacetate hydrolase family protein [Aeromonas cavernicola]
MGTEMLKHWPRYTLSAIAIFLASAAHACPSDKVINDYLTAFRQAKPAAGFGENLDMASALCAQQKVVSALTSDFGAVVGYKAAFTSKASQERFQIDGPLIGFMFKNGMRPDGSKVAVDYGARPMMEADLIAVVKSADIQKATTAQEALNHIESFVPFIELVDLALDTNVKMDAPTIVAINVAHRGGVLGKPVKIEDARAMFAALPQLTIVTRNADGVEMARDRGESMLGNPANIILFLAQDLSRRGIKLKAGDMLSLGSFPGPQAIKAGTNVTVAYEGLPGNPSVNVTFE